MKTFVTVLSISLHALLLCSCKKDNAAVDNKVEVITSNGNIQAEVDAFKNSLGALNLTPGAVSGRREINWDSVPDSLLDKQLPDNFFNETGPAAVPARQRGITYAGGSFMVSSSGFAAVNNAASSQFTAFSGTKLFANATAPQWTVAFQKAGTTENAFVRAFGLVFADVDLENSTSIEFFDGNESLGKFFVPAHSATSNFSFFGARAKNSEQITKISVVHDGFLMEGQTDVSDGGPSDLVVVDDFIYSEPIAQ